MWTMTTVRATTATTFAINGVISLPKKSLDSQQSSQETTEQLRCDQRGGRCVGCWSVWWCVAAGAADRKLLSVEVSAVKSRNSGRSGSVRPEQQQQHNGATVTSQTDTEKSRHIYTRLHNLHRYRCPLQFCFLFQTYFLDLILENENCFSCPGPSTPVLSCLIQISGLTEPRVASCTPPLDVNIDVNIKDLSNYSLTWPPHCKNRSQSALWVCAVLSLYSSLTWLSLMAIKVCRLSFDISYSNVFSLPDILYGISPWSRFKLVRYFIFRKTGGSGQRPCPWRRQPGSGCTSRPCQGESCLAGPALAVVHWSSQISLRSHLTSSTSISQLTYTFIIFCSAHQLLRK